MNKGERIGVITLLSLLVILAAINISIRSCHNGSITNNMINNASALQFKAKAEAHDSMTVKIPNATPKKKLHRAKKKDSQNFNQELPTIKDE